MYVCWAKQEPMGRRWTTEQLQEARLLKSSSEAPASPLPVAAARENEVQGRCIGPEAAGPSELLGLTTAGRPRSW